jgi:hypothetical protein
MRRLTVLAITAMAVLTLAGTAVGALSLTGKDIKNGSITGKDVKNKSLSKADFKGSVRGPRGFTGQQGAQGPAGPSVVARLTPQSASETVAAGAIDSVTATCPAGQRVVSGGYFMDSGFAFADKTYDGASWTVGVDNSDSLVSSDVEATALCAPAGVAVAASVSKRNAAIARDEARRRDSR